MHTKRIITESVYYQNIPLIDKGFDRFELNTDLDASVREAAAPALYHGDLTLTELGGRNFKTY